MGVKTMKKILLSFIGILVLVVFLVGCTQSQPMTKEQAIDKLNKAGCMWDPSNEDVKVELVDSEWVISNQDCLGICKINPETEDVYLDNNPMCTGVIVDDTDLPHVDDVTCNADTLGTKSYDKCNTCTCVKFPGGTYGNACTEIGCAIFS